MTAPSRLAPSVLEHLDAASLQALLPDFLASNVEGFTAEQVSGWVEDWTTSDYDRLLTGLRILGDEYRLYPADPSCRDLARRFMGAVLSTVRIEGLEHLDEAMGRGRTVIITNHLSYIDAMATDAALANSGHVALADRIAYLAGPKVYQDLFRLVAAACINSLPVPQSPQLGHTEQLPGRELARRAISSLNAGKEALKEGTVLLFYAEGSRSRSGRMGPFLQATRRYVKAADFVVPIAIDGTDAMFGVDAGRIQPGDLALNVAPAIPVPSGDGREQLVQAHAAIARMLPEAKRPLPDADALL